MSTPITTGHGPIPIERLDPLIHTIRGKRIVDVVSVVSDDRYLVCFEQDSLGKNLPSAKTIMSKEHKILWKGRLRPADEFVDLTDGIYKVRYNGELLYNVLMETYDCMMVNGLICETLDPANDVAELYKALRHLEPNERADYIDEINGYRKYLQR